MTKQILLVVKCPECKHVFATKKFTAQCGNKLKNGSICGKRFESYSHEV